MEDYYDVRDEYEQDNYREFRQDEYVDENVYDDEEREYDYPDYPDETPEKDDVDFEGFDNVDVMGGAPEHFEGIQPTQGVKIGKEELKVLAGGVILTSQELFLSITRRVLEANDFYSHLHIDNDVILKHISGIRNVSYKNADFVAAAVGWKVWSLDKNKKLNRPNFQEYIKLVQSQVKFFETEIKALNEVDILRYIRFLL